MKKIFIIFMLLFTYLVSFGYQCAGSLEEDVEVYSLICDRITLFAERAKLAQSLGYKAIVFWILTPEHSCWLPPSTGAQKFHKKVSRGLDKAVAGLDSTGGKHSEKPSK